jgi:ABC-type branched-subunit amino acid transport system permease subunit
MGKKILHAFLVAVGTGAVGAGLTWVGAFDPTSVTHDPTLIAVLAAVAGGLSRLFGALVAKIK